MDNPLTLFDVEALDLSPSGRQGRIPSWSKMKAEELWRAWREQFDSDDAAIATAIWMTNRMVKDMSQGSRRTFYSIKDEFIRRYATTGRKTREEVKPCWGCTDGVTEWGEVCERCDGTGVYQSRWLYLHEFVVAGQRYALHSYIEPKVLLPEPSGDAEQFGRKFSVDEQRALALPFSGLLRMLTYVAAALWKLQSDNGAYR